MPNPSPRIDAEVSDQRRQHARLRAIAERAEALALANAQAPDLIDETLSADAELRFFKGIGNGLALSLLLYAIALTVWWAVS